MYNAIAPMIISTFLVPVPSLKVAKEIEFDTGQKSRLISSGQIYFCLFDPLFRSLVVAA
jgi:hypothetical protein